MTAPDEAGEGRPGDGRRTTAGDAGRPADGGSSSYAVYRWTCPLCGEAGTGMASGNEDPFAKAAFSLRQHVRTSVDGDHGPANVLPHGFDPDAAGRAVSVD